VPFCTVAAPAVAQQRSQVISRSENFSNQVRWPAIPDAMKGLLDLNDLTDSHCTRVEGWLPFPFLFPCPFPFFLSRFSFLLLSSLPFSSPFFFFSLFHPFWIQLMGLGERYKLLQWCLGQNLSCQLFLGIMSMKKCISNLFKVSYTYSWYRSRAIGGAEPRRWIFQLALSGIVLPLFLQAKSKMVSFHLLQVPTEHEQMHLLFSYLIGYLRSLRFQNYFYIYYPFHALGRGGRHPTAKHVQNVFIQNIFFCFLNIGGSPWARHHWSKIAIFCDPDGACPLCILFCFVIHVSSELTSDFGFRHHPDIMICRIADVCCFVMRGVSDDSMVVKGNFQCFWALLVWNQLGSQ